MGEEEKVAAEGEAPDAGAAPEGTPDLGMPGGFAPTGGGADLTLKRSIFFGIIAGFIFITVLSVYISFKMGKTNGLLKEGTIKMSNEFMGPVYPLEEIKTNIFSSHIEESSSQTPVQERALELKVNIILNNNEAIEEVNKRYPQIIDHLFYLVHKRGYEDLDSIPDQNKFKRKIKDELNTILSYAKVKEVYFEKFRIIPIEQKNFIEWNDKK